MRARHARCTQAPPTLYTTVTYTCDSARQAVNDKKGVRDCAGAPAWAAAAAAGNAGAAEHGTRLPRVPHLVLGLSRRHQTRDRTGRVFGRPQRLGDGAHPKRPPPRRRLPPPAACGMPGKGAWHRLHQGRRPAAGGVPARLHSQAIHGQRGDALECGRGSGEARTRQNCPARSRLARLAPLSARLDPHRQGQRPSHDWIGAGLNDNSEVVAASGAAVGSPQGDRPQRLIGRQHAPQEAGQRHCVSGGRHGARRRHVWATGHRLWAQPQSAARRRTAADAAEQQAGGSFGAVEPSARPAPAGAAHGAAGRACCTQMAAGWLAHPDGKAFEQHQHGASSKTQPQHRTQRHRRRR